MTDNTGVTTVQKFKEKPNVIEARQFLTEQDGRELAEWVGGQLFIDPENGNPTNVKLTLVVSSPIALYDAHPGDYITKSGQGFFGVLSKEVFEKNFEKVGK